MPQKLDFPKYMILEILMDLCQFKGQFLTNGLQHRVCSFSNISIIERSKINLGIIK